MYYIIETCRQVETENGNTDHWWWDVAEKCFAMNDAEANQFLREYYVIEGNTQRHLSIDMFDFGEYKWAEVGDVRRHNTTPNLFFGVSVSKISKDVIDDF